MSTTGSSSAPSQSTAAQSVASNDLKALCRAFDEALRVTQPTSSAEAFFGHHVNPGETIEISYLAHPAPKFNVGLYRGDPNGPTVAYKGIDRKNEPLFMATISLYNLISAACEAHEDMGGLARDLQVGYVGTEQVVRFIPCDRLV